MLSDLPTCVKTTYDTEAIAKARAVEINTENTTSGVGPTTFRSYVCPTCGKFHLTSQTRSTYRRRQRKFLKLRRQQTNND